MGYRWVKALPFNVLLVDTMCYDEPVMALRGQRGAVLRGFNLMSEREIAESKTYNISIPLKRIYHDKEE